MDRVRGWWCRWRHEAFHWRVARDGELFLRCAICGFRSPGVTVGPARVRRTYAGVPERHRLRRRVARVLRIEGRRMDIGVEKR